jgi:hypothetical protein
VVYHSQYNYSQLKHQPSVHPYTSITQWTPRCRSTYFAMISIFPQCSILLLITLSTVSLTRTSHNRPRQFLSCQFCICSIVFSCVQPTAVHWSPCDSRARTSDRPMCPVAPKTLGILHQYAKTEVVQRHALSMKPASAGCVRTAGRMSQAVSSLVGRKRRSARGSGCGSQRRSPWHLVVFGTRG